MTADVPVTSRLETQWPSCLTFTFDIHTRMVACEERQLWVDAVVASLLAKRALGNSVIVKVRGGHSVWWA